MSRLLLVEDNAKLSKTLCEGLREEGFDVIVTATGEGAIEALATVPLDLVILDWMLPGIDGLTVLCKLRERNSSPPVVMLTARDSVSDRVHGLESGADDYLVKPFAFAELLARVRALLRRNSATREILIRVNALEINLVERRVTRAGQPIELTRREFDLLAYLAQHKGTPVTRAMLARDVWKETDDSLATATNVIEVCINVLRRKVELPGQPRLIHTVRGMGYSLREAICDD